MDMVGDEIEIYMVSDDVNVGTTSCFLYELV